MIPVRTSNTSGPSIKASDDAGLAAEMMGRHHTDVLVVKDEKEGDKVLGVITARNLLSFYSKQRQKEHDYESPARTRRILVQGRKLFRPSRT
jgi:CBS domain-containing protein